MTTQTKSANKVHLKVDKTRASADETSARAWLEPSEHGKDWLHRFDKLLEKAKQEGVVNTNGDEATNQEIDDGSHAPEESYFCKICRESLSLGALEMHLESAEHRDAYRIHVEVAASVSAPSPPNNDTCSQKPVHSFEAWQELDLVNGWRKCIPCKGKVINPSHLASAEHQRRLQQWLEDEEEKKKGFTTPELPYLAYVPEDEDDPSSRRYLMCLLCAKGKKTGTWVMEPGTHCGTHEVPGGSKEHMKNLQNCRPQDPWYIENVTQRRLRYHPAKQIFASSHESQAHELAEGLHIEPQELPLLPGWRRHKDPRGRTYYYHEVERVPQWQAPR